MHEANATSADALTEHHTACFGWAMSCCGRNRADAEDVLSLAYDKVLSGHARFLGTSSFKTWLFGVIRRTAIDERRKRAWRNLLQLRFFEAPVSDPTPETMSETNQRAAALTRALTQLSERQREVLHLVFYEGLTIREAAITMDVSTGTASLHYERGKARLAAMLREQGIEG